MTEAVAPDRIELSPIDTATLTRYHAQLTTAQALIEVFDEGVGDTDAEISLCQQRLAFLQERLAKQRDDLIAATAKAQEADSLLRTVQAQVAGNEGVEIEHYELDVTPNGTVTALSRKA